MQHAEAVGEVVFVHADVEVEFWSEVACHPCLVA
jgi:hypothetical protein